MRKCWCDRMQVKKYRHRLAKADSRKKCKTTRHLFPVTRKPKPQIQKQPPSKPRDKPTLIVIPGGK